MKENKLKFDFVLGQMSGDKLTWKGLTA